MSTMRELLFPLAPVPVRLCLHLQLLLATAYRVYDSTDKEVFPPTSYLLLASPGQAKRDAHGPYPSRSERLVLAASRHNQSVLLLTRNVAAVSGQWNVQP